MRIFKLCQLYASLLLLFATSYATELFPWLPPLFEFEGRLTPLFERVDRAQSPLGNFRAPINNASLQLGMDVTPWPNWNAEVELYLTHTHQTNFTYEAALCTLRYAWLDDLAGDDLSLVTGVTLSFPNHTFLHQLSFPYHGPINAEFHATVGKEWSCREDWLFRMWGVGGLGVANRGSPWLYSLIVAEGKTSLCTTVGLAIDALYGLGSHNLLPKLPFKGYASIDHRNIDLSGFFTYYLPHYGTFAFLGWYNLYAHNFIWHYWGVSLSFLIPLSII